MEKPIYTKEQREILKERTKADADLLISLSMSDPDFAGYEKDGRLAPTKKQVKSMKTEMDEDLEYRVERIRAKREKMKRDKIISEATSDPEKRKIREEMSREFCAPLEKYETEVLADLNYIGSLSDSGRSNLSVFLSFCPSPKSEDEAMSVKKVMDIVSDNLELAQLFNDTREMSEIRRAQLRALLSLANSENSFINMGERELRCFMGAYGNGDRMRGRLDVGKNAVMLLSPTRGVYSISSYDGCSHDNIGNIRDAFIEDNKCLPIGFGSSNNCVTTHYSMDRYFEIYLLLKAIEKDSSEDIAIGVPCESGNNCAGSLSENFRHFLPNMEDYGVRFVNTGSLTRYSKMAGEFMRKQSEATGRA